MHFMHVTDGPSSSELDMQVAVSSEEQQAQETAQRKEEQSRQHRRIMGRGESFMIAGSRGQSQAAGARRAPAVWFGWACNGAVAIRNHCANQTGPEGSKNMQLRGCHTGRAGGGLSSAPSSMPPKQMHHGSGVPRSARHAVCLQAAAETGVGTVGPHQRHGTKAFEDARA